MKDNFFEMGDMVAVDGRGCKHVGIYVGRDRLGTGLVVHNMKNNAVVVSSWAEFSGGGKVYMHNKATCPEFQRQEIVRRALSLCGKRYDLFTFNCEHAAYYAQTGQSVSPQLAGFTVLALIIGGIAILAHSDG